MPRKIFCAFICMLLYAQGSPIAVRSGYACEGKKLVLTCPSYQILRIFKALFGREEPGTRICPNDKINSTTCAAKRSIEVVNAKCDNKNKCNVLADSTTFGGDPCPGTFKYLDVIYACMSRPMKSTMTTFLKSFTLEINSTTTASAPNATSPPNRTEPAERTTLPLTPTPTGATTTAPQGQPGVGFTAGAEEKPRYTIVIFLAVVAGITVSLLLVLTVVHICKRNNEKRKFKVQMEEADKDSASPQPKTVTIEIQGSKEETREIHVSPGDIIIIDHNELNSAGSEDLGYLSEIVRYYNGHSTTASDDQSSLRKRSLTCGSPSVISTEMSESDKKPEVKTEQPVANGNCISSPPIDITVNPLCAS